MFRALFLTALLSAPAYAEVLTFPDIAGHYRVTSARMASDVAQPFNPDAQDPTGFELMIDEDGFQIPFRECSDWSLAPTEVFIHPRFDPNLADVFLEPAAAFDTYTVLCEGNYLTLLTYVDDRVLVITIENEGTWAVLEKPLTQDEVAQVQAALVEKGLLETASGVMDDATHAALRLHFRAEFEDGHSPIPLRPAYTRAFLRTLGVE